MPSSEARNEASFGDATKSRNTFRSTSTTDKLSNGFPSQNCSKLRTKDGETGLRLSCLTAMCTGVGANSGEQGATGVHTRVLKFCRASWRKASPGVANGGGRASGSTASARGVLADRKPWAGACPEEGLPTGMAASGPRGLLAAPSRRRRGGAGGVWWLNLGLEE
jgi:hypothetical protein